MCVILFDCIPPVSVSEVADFIDEVPSLGVLEIVLSMGGAERGV